MVVRRTMGIAMKLRCKDKTKPECETCDRFYADQTGASTMLVNASRKHWGPWMRFRPDALPANYRCAVCGGPALYED